MVNNDINYHRILSLVNDIVNGVNGYLNTFMIDQMS